MVPKRPVGARTFGRGGAGKAMTEPSGEGSSKGKGKAKEEDKGKDKERKGAREPRHAWFGKRWTVSGPSSSKTGPTRDVDEDYVVLDLSAAAAEVDVWPWHLGSESDERVGGTSTTSHPSGSGGSGQEPSIPTDPDGTHTPLSSPSNIASSPLPWRKSSLPRLSQATNGSSPPPSRPLPTPPQPGPSQPSSNSPPPEYITGHHSQPHHDLLSFVRFKTRRWSSPARQAPTRKKSKRRPKVHADTTAAAAASVPPIIIERLSQEEEEEEEEFMAPPPPYEQVGSDASVSAVTLPCPLAEDVFTFGTLTR